jgi:hypothetical protein
MKYQDSAPRVYHVEAPDNLRLGGFAVTDSNRVYGRFSHGGTGGLYSLSYGTGDSASWRPVEGTIGLYTMPGVITELWGSDGENLVVNRAEDPIGRNALHWVKAVQAQ